MCNYILLLILCNLGENTQRCVSFFLTLNSISYRKIASTIKCIGYFQKNAGISTELYNMPWYLLPTQHQKEVRCVIHWVDNGAILTIGPFMELNFESASNVSIAVLELP